MYIDLNAYPPMWSPSPSWLVDLTTTLLVSRKTDPVGVAALVKHAPIALTDLLSWSEFDHPVHESYGRKLAARGPGFEIMIMSWAPGDYSAIHDHGAAQWGVVRYFGRAEHVQFELRNNTLSICEHTFTRPGDVSAVDPNLIHLMGNPTTEPFLSLHVYGRRGSSSAITEGARVFDLLDGAIQYTDGGVFHCLPATEIRAYEVCPPSDPQATELHHRLMLNQIDRMLRAGLGDVTIARKRSRLMQELDRLQCGAASRAVG